MAKRRGLDVIDEKQQQQVENTKHTHTYKSLLYRLFHDCRINPVHFRHSWFLKLQRTGQTVILLLFLLFHVVLDTNKTTRYVSLLGRLDSFISFLSQRRLFPLKVVPHLYHFLL